MLVQKNVRTINISTVQSSQFSIQVLMSTCGNAIYCYWFQCELYIQLSKIKIMDRCNVFTH
jgi:hypothetical protein